MTPQARFGHTAVAFNSKLIVLGGQETDSDEILSDDPTYDIGAHPLLYNAILSSPSRS